MRAIVQRVAQAEVTVAGEVVGAIGPGLMVLAGFEDADQDTDLRWMAGKLVRMRIFPDAQGLMNRSVQDLGGGILVVSQFTLFASYQHGNRPSYLRAARPERAGPAYAAFVLEVGKALGRPVASGRFGADMRISLVNDGPVTIALDSRDPQ